MSAPSTSSLLVESLSRVIDAKYGCFTFTFCLYGVRQSVRKKNYGNDGDDGGGGSGCRRSGDGHGSYNPEKVLNFSSRLEKSLNSVKILKSVLDFNTRS